MTSQHRMVEKKYEAEEAIKLLKRIWDSHRYDPQGWDAGPIEETIAILNRCPHREDKEEEEEEGGLFFLQVRNKRLKEEEE